MFIFARGFGHYIVFQQILPLQVATAVLLTFQLELSLLRSAQCALDMLM